MKRLIVLSVLSVVLVALSVAITTPANAGPMVKAPVLVVSLDPGMPQGACDADHIWDIEVINGVLFSCECEAMPYGEPVCDWYEITSQADDPVRLRKYIKWARYWRHHIVYRYVRVVKAVVR